MTTTRSTQSAAEVVKCKKEKLQQSVITQKPIKWWM